MAIKKEINRKPRKIRKDDKVVVIAGNSRGKMGTVLNVNGDKVLVQGVNLRKKHQKATRTTKGEIIDIEMPMHISNLKVMANDKPVKLRTRVVDGKRELYYQEGNESTVYRTLSSRK